MQSVEEILYLHEDDVVEMKQGGRVPFQKGGEALDRKKYDELLRLLQRQDELKSFSYNPNFDAEFGFSTLEPTREQYAQIFERNFNVRLTGDETLDELGHLYELLAEFQEQIPNLSPRNRGGVYLAGKKASLKKIAKDYADFGKANIDAVAKEYGIDYANSHREQRKAVKNFISQRKSASSVDDARLLFDKQDEIEKIYDTLVNNFEKKTGRPVGQSDKVKLRKEAINRIAGREKSEIARKLKNFKNKEVVLVKEKGRVVDVVFKDPAKQAEFVSDLEFRFLYPESSGGGVSSYAKQAGVLDQEAFRKKYFKEYSKSTVNDITGAVAKAEGFKKPTMEEFITAQQIETGTNAKRMKSMKDKGFRHYIDTEGKLIEMMAPAKSKRLTISQKLDPLNVKQDIINQKIGMGLDTSHSIKNPLLNPDKPGPQFKAETLDTLYPVRSDLNRGPMGGFDRSVLNIAEEQLEQVVKDRSNLIDKAGRIIKGKEDEFARLQAKGKRIVRNYSQADELFGTVYRGAPGKASGPTNVKGVLNFEVFTPGADGKLTGKLVGGDVAKSYAGLSKDPVAKKSFAQFTKADKSQAVGIVKDTISKLKGRELGTVCRAISKFGFAVGGDVTASCLKAVEDNPVRAITAISKISKPTGKLRNLVNLSKTLAKGTGYALLGELAVAAPIALYQYGQGESKERMIGDATYGLAGQTIDDEKREFMGEEGFKAHKLVDDLGQLDNLTAQFQDSETIMMPEDEELNIQQMSKKEKDIAEGLKSYEAEDGSFDREKFDRDFDTGSAGLKNLEDVKGFRRDVRRDEDYDVFEDEVAAAGGGLITLNPRKPQALPPESGPNPQGLENLKYYVTST
jgi:hypothetical protein